MRRHVRRQCGEEFLGPHIPVVTRRPLQAPAIKRWRLFAYPLKYFSLAFGGPVQVVHKVDQKKLRAQCLGKGRFHAKFKRAASKRKAPMSLVVVDHRLVIELRRTTAEHVVSIRRGEQKTAVLKKSTDQL